LLPTLSYTGGSAEVAYFAQVGVEGPEDRPVDVAVTPPFGDGDVQPPREIKRHVRRVGPLALNPAEHAATKDGHPLDLTVTEFRVLHHLMAHAGAVVRTRELMKEVWGFDDPSGNDTVRVAVYRLRRKLEDDPANPRLLHTVAGVGVMLKAVGVPIDHYSYEAVELLKDIAARWATDREVRRLAGCAANADAPICTTIHAPDAEIFAIDVSFAALADPVERAYLNQQPTSFVLPAEAVDRLRKAAGTIIEASPEFQRLLKDVGARVLTDPSAGGGATGGAH